MQIRKETFSMKVLMHGHLSGNSITQRLYFSATDRMIDYYTVYLSEWCYKLDQNLDNKVFYAHKMVNYWVLYFAFSSLPMSPLGIYLKKYFL